MVTPACLPIATVAHNLSMNTTKEANNMKPMVYETAVSQGATRENTGSTNSTEHRVSTKRAKGGAR